MLRAVGNYANYGFVFLEKGLAHPSFLGRAVSWGLFYGTLALLVAKITPYAIRKISSLWKNRSVRTNGDCPSTDPTPNTQETKEKQTPPPTPVKTHRDNSLPNNMYQNEPKTPVVSRKEDSCNESLEHKETSEVLQPGKEDSFLKKNIQVITENNDLSKKKLTNQRNGVYRTIGTS